MKPEIFSKLSSLPSTQQSEEVDGSFFGLLNGRGSANANGASGTNGFRQVSLTLPATPPPGLSQQELKRRHIFAAIVHSECSYVSTLQRLVNVSASDKSREAIASHRTIHEYSHFYSLLPATWVDVGLQETIGRE